MKRREPIGRRMSRRQSDADPPSQEFVSVAVLPPRLPSGMAPPTGLGVADTMAWDESINWQHNDPVEENVPEPSTGRKFLRKIGLTTKRERLHSDAPPFMFRQVTYDTWRKHYAKDADGNYHGTHAPASDCLLKPADVAKWSYGAPKTIGDKYTRGQEALPVYAEVESDGRVPEYVDYSGIPPEGEPTLSGAALHEQEEEEHRMEHAATTESVARTESVATTESVARPESLTKTESTTGPTSLSAPPTNVSRKSVGSGLVIADGKTAAEIIEEARLKKASQPKMGWKQQLKKASEFTMLGAGS